MKYRLAIKPSASRELERLQDQLLRRADEAIRKLADNPRPQWRKETQWRTVIPYTGRDLSDRLRGE